VLAEYRHQQTRRTERKDRRMTGPVKLKTAGIAAKVPAQALATLVVSALAYYGIDLDAQVSAAVGVAVGFAAGYAAPAAPTVSARTRRSRVRSEAGQVGVEAVVVLLVVVILVIVLLRLA
jgi:putative flippase GtrA